VYSFSDQSQAITAALNASKLQFRLIGHKCTKNCRIAVTGHKYRIYKWVSDFDVLLVYDVDHQVLAYRAVFMKVHLAIFNQWHIGLLTVLWLAIGMQYIEASDLPPVVLSPAIPDVAPWGWVEQNDIQGIYGDWAKAILKRANYHYTENRVYPFARVLSRLEEGQSDFAIFSKHIADLNEALVPVKFVASMEYVLFFKKENTDFFPTWRDFEDKTVAIINGGLYLSEFDENINIKKYKASDYREMVSMLESDRVDGIVELYDSLLVEFKREPRHQSV